LGGSRGTRGRGLYFRVSLVEINNVIISNMHYWQMSAKDVLRSVNSSMKGLTEDQIIESRKLHGENIINSKKQNSAIRIFFRQFYSPLIIILLIAVFITVVLAEYVDAIIIFLAVFINVILGFFEEYKADRSLQALKSYLPVEVRVRRGGDEILIRSEEVVIGDILLLASGDRITADGRILKLNNFETSEAALTGESSDIVKLVDILGAGVGIADRRNFVFAGTVAVSGNAEVVVTAIGQKTELGKVNKLVQETIDEETPLQRQLAKLATRLGTLSVFAAFLTFAVGFFRGYEVQELFYTSVALAVAAVPEGLVIAMTVILALGMQRILRKKALVRKLVAAETLGSVNVICLDKTGTVTTGEMKVGHIFKNEFKIDKFKLGAEIFLSALMDFATSQKSPTAIGLKRYIEDNNIRHEFDLMVAELPFDSRNKFSGLIARMGHENFLIVIGAPDVLAKRADIADEESLWLAEKVDEIVMRGDRSIALGVKEFKGSKLELSDVNDLEVLALIGMTDPIRDDAKASVKLAESAGLRSVMITGDHPGTAFRIANEIGFNVLERQMLTGVELDELSDEQLVQKIKHIRIYARVLPEHKLRIVRAWHAVGAAVAMTGDGVNDAPALKAANIGIALGSGTEVAKETADMVLLDNRFSTIVEAIREGRIIFDNIRKVTTFLLISNFAEVLVIFVSVLLGMPLAILPVQILWINLVTDGIPSLSLMFEDGEDGIMKEKPRSKDEAIINKGILMIILFMGAVTAGAVLGIFIHLIGAGYELNYARTAVFYSLGLSTVTYLFSIRVFRSNILVSHPLKNKYILVATVLGWVLQFLPMAFEVTRKAFDLVNLEARHWLMLAIIALIQLIVMDLSKIFLRLNK
jgi:Ca2+-transporting ATPase